MIRICSYCKKNLGEKEPLDDKSETHGICQECLDGLLKKINDAKKDYESAFCQAVEGCKAAMTVLDRARRVE